MSSPNNNSKTHHLVAEKGRPHKRSSRSRNGNEGEAERSVPLPFQQSLVIFLVYFHILVLFVAVSFFDSCILIEKLIQTFGFSRLVPLHRYIQCGSSHLLLLGIRQA